MKISLHKIKCFYESSLGEYAFIKIKHVLKKQTLDYSFKKSTCICSAGLFKYTNLFKNKVKRLCFQAYETQKSWPIEGEDNYIITDRNQWAYRAEDVDYIFIGHDLEFAEDPQNYLREAFRVLKGEGQLIIMFPNRSGKWARFDNNPFGDGYPYTIDQMKKLLQKSHFTIDKVDSVLFYPAHQPKSSIALLYRKFIDRFGVFFFMEPGIYVIRASKHIYAPTSGLKVAAVEKAKQVLFPSPTTASTSSSKTSKISK